MKYITLTRGCKTAVDDDVYEWASQHKWYALKARHTFYAVRNIRLPDGRKSTCYLHREILGLSAKELVDHWDLNGLHNLRSNLRVGGKAKNAQNMRRAIDNASGYKGVSRHLGGRWRARIKVENREIWLGYFDLAIDAAFAYDSEAARRHGEFARLNFPFRS